MPISQRLEAAFLAPLAILLVGTIVFPAVILFGYSLFVWVSLQTTGGVTFANYIESLTDPLYRQLAINTLAIAVPTTLASVAGGYAIAYYIVFVQERGRSLMFALVVSALMASYIVRIFAWRTMLGERGILNSALVATGLIGQPLDFLLFSRTSAILAEVALFMPLAALAFYASLSGVSGSYREAAWDLGAGRLQELWRVTLPLSGPSILATTTLTFFLSAGDYITPVMVGGADSTTIGTAIAATMGRAADYGLGAAVSFVTMVGFVICYVLIRAAMRAGNLLPARTTT